MSHLTPTRVSSVPASPDALTPAEAFIEDADTALRSISVAQIIPTVQKSAMSSGDARLRGLLEVASTTTTPSTSPSNRNGVAATRWRNRRSSTTRKKTRRRSSSHLAPLSKGFAARFTRVAVSAAGTAHELGLVAALLLSVAVRGILVRTAMDDEPVPQYLVSVGVVVLGVLLLAESLLQLGVAACVAVTRRTVIRTFAIMTWQWWALDLLAALSLTVEIGGIYRAVLDLDHAPTRLLIFLLARLLRISRALKLLRTHRVSVDDALIAITGILKLWASAVNTAGGAGGAGGGDAAAATVGTPLRLARSISLRESSQISPMSTLEGAQGEPLGEREGSGSSPPLDVDPAVAALEQGRVLALRTSLQRLTSAVAASNGHQMATTNTPQETPLSSAPTTPREMGNVHALRSPQLDVDRRVLALRSSLQRLTSAVAESNGHQMATTNTPQETPLSSAPTTPRGGGRRHTLCGEASAPQRSTPLRAQVETSLPAAKRIL